LLPVLLLLLLLLLLVMLQAFAQLFAQMKVDILDPAYADYAAAFAQKIIQYHTLIVR
jgi:hypothetical protein